MKYLRLLLGLAALLVMTSAAAWAKPAEMHILEGFLPPFWAIFWWVVMLPFWAIGWGQVRKTLREKPESRLLLGMSAGFIFVLSALKMPSVTGSSSHPTGTGLGTVLFGPFVVTILGSIVLIFQALLLTHGGISTLGANAFSMGVAGPLAGWGLWLLLRRIGAPGWLAVFLAAALANLVTYAVTATQLALAHPDPVGGFLTSWLTFLGIFAVTQIPLALSEGILASLIYGALQTTAPEELRQLGLKEA